MDMLYNYEVEIEEDLFKVIFDNGFYSYGNRPVNIHNHSLYEVHIIEKGEFTLNVEGKTINLSDNMCCIISPKTYHSLCNILSEDTCKYCFKFSLIEKSAKSDICKYINEIDKIYSYEHCLEEISLLKKIRYEMDEKKTGYLDNLKNLSSQMLILLIRKVENYFSANRNKIVLRAYEDRSTVIDGFFAQNYAKDIHANDLAQLLNVSLRQLARIMPKYYGLTFKEKLSQIRIYAAKERILNTDMTLMEIAEAVGYNNINYFNEAFKKIVKTTPVAFRKEKFKLVPEISDCIK